MLKGVKTVKNNTMGKDYRKPACRQKGHKFKKSNAKPDTKKSVEDYCLHTGSVNHVSDYDTTLQFTINHIKKTYVRGMLCLRRYAHALNLMCRNGNLH